MSLKNSEPEWTFTASWRVSSTDSLLTSLNQLRGELASNLNSRADTVLAVRQLSGQHVPGHTVRLFISRMNEESKRVISIEERTEES